MPPKQPNHACVLRPPGVARTGRTSQHRAAEPRACEPSAFLVWYAALHAVWPAAKRCAAAWMSLPQARTMSTTSRRTSCCATPSCPPRSTCRSTTAPRPGAGAGVGGGCCARARARLLVCCARPPTCAPHAPLLCCHQPHPPSPPNHTHTHTRMNTHTHTHTHTHTQTAATTQHQSHNR